MWVFFGSKCVKVILFSILEDYKRIDVDALKHSFRQQSSTLFVSNFFFFRNEIKYFQV